MPFENEHTFLKFMIAKKEELFHNQYEQAILDVKSEFGRQYPLIIGGKKKTKGWDMRGTSAAVEHCLDYLLVDF